MVWEAALPLFDGNGEGVESLLEGDPSRANPPLVSAGSRRGAAHNTGAAPSTPTCGPAQGLEPSRARKTSRTSKTENSDRGSRDRLTDTEHRHSFFEYCERLRAEQIRR